MGGGGWRGWPPEVPDPAAFPAGPPTQGEATLAVAFSPSPSPRTKSRAPVQKWPLQTRGWGVERDTLRLAKVRTEERS